MLAIITFIKTAFDFLFNGRGIIILSLGLLFVTLFFGRGCLRNHRHELKASSLLHQVEYMDRLDLVTYFYEELLTIGTTSQLEKAIRTEEAELGEARKALLEADYQLAIADQTLEALKNELEKKISRDSLVMAEKLSLEAVTKFQAIDQPFKRLLDVLASKSETFSPRIKSAFSTYDLLDGQLETAKQDIKKRDLKELNDAVDEAEKALQSEIKKETELRKNIRDYYQADYQKRFQKIQAIEEDYKRELHKAEKVLAEAKDRRDNAQREITNREIQLQAAIDDWKKRREMGLDESNPRLVTVANARVTAYLNLRDMRSELQGDTMVFFLPEPQLDSVWIELDSSRLYQLARQKLSFSREEGGLYYDIFRQIQLAVRDVSADVRVKAVDRGIYAETLEMGRAYFLDMARSLNMPCKVVIPSEVVPEKEVPQPQIEVNDSIHPPKM